MRIIKGENSLFLFRFWVLDQLFLRRRIRLRKTFLLPFLRPWSAVSAQAHTMENTIFSSFLWPWSAVSAQAHTIEKNISSSFFETLICCFCAGAHDGEHYFFFIFVTLFSCFCAGAHDGEDVLVHAVWENLQRAAHPAPPPQDPQLRVPGAVLRLQEGLQNKVAGETDILYTGRDPHFLLHVFPLGPGLPVHPLPPSSCQLACTGRGKI